MAHAIAKTAIQTNNQHITKSQTHSVCAHEDTYKFENDKTGKDFYHNKSYPQITEIAIETTYTCTI